MLETNISVLMRHLDMYLNYVYYIFYIIVLNRNLLNVLPIFIFIFNLSKLFYVLPDLLWSGLEIQLSLTYLCDLKMITPGNVY